MSATPPSASGNLAAGASTVPAAVLSEAQLHHAVAEFLDFALPKDAVWHHSPNEGKRGWHAQRSLKRGGTKKGWPDIEIIWEGRAYFIELKSTKGTVKEAQRALHLRICGAGSTVVVCRSLASVQSVLRSWGMNLRCVA